MAIVTGKNTSYGPPLVNDKYTPLDDIEFRNDDGAIYTGLLQNRMNMLKSLGLIDQGLELTVPNWVNTVAAEATHLPPLVVVSSNRARWIRTGIDAAGAQLLTLGVAHYDSASDLRALTGDLGISPPLYTPSRLGLNPNRNVYVVVNIAEYDFYKKTLAGTGITPVGWSFAKAAGARRNLSLLGFGATRFAAMEFCKTLRQQAAAKAGGTAPWNSAWIIDDNVVALSNFPGFAAVEAVLNADPCVGFQGGTKAEPAAANKAWAKKEIASQRGQQAAGLPTSWAASGIVQQAALWNVAYFDTQRLNFGRLFITSAEDVSIVKYFDSARPAAIPYRFYSGISVHKENPTPDKSNGAAKVNKGRQDLTMLIADAESASPPIGTPPPPIRVMPREVRGVEQTLSDFIIHKVLPSASEEIRKTAGSEIVRAQAKSQGVEQLTSGALGAGFVDAAAIKDTFKINGTGQQVVQRRDRP
ncbi:hypothetical protein [Streptacidiphilus anmyonensis]|uniref:hypothetical protein n=1 Tax=Streptacidiphilus anmyonensis TaxID=405782 RepID=UPI0005AAFC71|nr:hypothetical protein [Streptacidiphilus anmyonensis]